MTRSLPAWLGILGGLVALSAGLVVLLSAQGHDAAAHAVLVTGNALVSTWVVWGLIVWHAVPWVAWVTRVLVLTLVAQLLASLCYALGMTGAAMLVVGAWGMGVAFYIGLSLLRLALVGGHPVLGVARTMLDEAIRQKVGLIFVVILVVLVPMLPLILSDSRLEYRVSNFLRYSMFVTGMLLSVMTILLAARSLATDMDSKVSYTTLVKPVPRWQYLLGKWLGIMMLNAVLLAVAGVGIYTFTRVLTRDVQRDAMDVLDAAAVTEQVLTARVGVVPSEAQPGELRALVEARLDQLRKNLRPSDLDYDVYFSPATGQAVPFDALPESVRIELQNAAVSDWLSIPDRGSKTYRFTGLEDAASYTDLVQLRFKPEARGSAPPDKKVQLFFRVNGREYRNPATVNGMVPRLAEDRFHVLYIPTEVIGEDGVLELEVFSGGRGAPPQPSISFNPADGLQVLYRVGGFETNLVKALAMLWVRLMFLAMLGLAAATFLGFPVACMLCGLVFVAAAGSAYLAESLKQYGSFPKDSLPMWQQVLGFFDVVQTKIGEGKYYDAFKAVIRLIGELFTAMVPSLGDYNPAPMLADGRAITLGALGSAAAKVGGLWTGVLGLVAAAIFHRREVAEVTV